MALPELQLMSRRACCLCDDARTVAEALAARGLCRLEVVDVDQDIELARLYGMDVPVLLINGEARFKHRIGFEELESALNEAMGETLC